MLAGKAQLPLSSPSLRRLTIPTFLIPRPLVVQACSEEFCEYYPHSLIPNPGYWIECSRVIQSSSASYLDKVSKIFSQHLDCLVIKELDEELEELGEDEGLGLSDASRPRRLSQVSFGTLQYIQKQIPSQDRKRSNIEEHWSRYGQFELTSVLQVP